MKTDEEEIAAGDVQPRSKQMTQLEAEQKVARNSWHSYMLEKNCLTKLLKSLT